MTAKEYLNQFRRMQERIREMNLSIQRIEDQLDVKGMSYDGMPGGGTGADRTAELVSKMCDIKMQREVVKQSAQLLCVEIENVIDKVRADCCMTAMYWAKILKQSQRTCT